MWCTDPGVPPQEGRGTCSPTEREVFFLNSDGSSAKNTIPRSAQSFQVLPVTGAFSQCIYNTCNKAG